MTTSRILNGLDGLIKGMGLGTVIGGSSALAGAAVLKGLGFLSASTPIGPIVSSGIAGWSLASASISSYIGYKYDMSLFNDKTPRPPKEANYQKAAQFTVVTAGLGIAGKLLLQACSQPNPTMKEIVPAMFVGAAIYHYFTEWLTSATSPKKEEVATPSFKA